MPPSKVCPQCNAVVPIRLKACKSCQHMFRAKRQIEHTLPARAMKRLRVGLSDSVKSVIKAKEKLQKACKRAAESSEQTLHRQQQNKEHVTSVRAAESSEQTLHRQQHDREYKASVRAAESSEQSLHRQQQNKEHMASVRAAESSEQTLHRQQHDREYKASVRAAESSEQSLHRQQQNKEHMASMRAAESSEQTLHRQQHDREYKASVRAAESSEQSLHRQQQNKEHMASVRAAKKANDVSIEQAIVSFHSDIKNGPDFVCTCCHRLMYRKSAVPCNPAKYSKCSNDLLNCVFSADLRYVCDTGNEYICKTCDRALKRGVMPVQAKANGLKLPEIPPELADLNALELRLICLRLPFMKMVALPTGKQRSIHGPAVNVPSKVDTVCNILPRLPSQSELIPLKLKRKLAYKGHYMYDYITPQKLLDALSFLKANNPLYADIDVNQEWLEAAVANDAELCECLVEQQNDIDQQPNTDNTVKPIVDSPTDIDMDCSDSDNVGPTVDPQATVASPTDSDDVQSIVDCVANVDSPTEIAMECNDPLLSAMHKLETIASQNGFTIHDVPADGDCMFSAIVYQLSSIGIHVDSPTLRQNVVDYLQANKASYCDFVCQPVARTDGYNADTVAPTKEDKYIASIADPLLQTELTWQKYLKQLEDGAWGDNIAMQAISDMLSVTITVLSSHYPAYSVTPQNHCATNELFVGLIMQFHYVGLDKIPEPAPPVADKPVLPDQPHSEPDSDDELDDATIAEGDEHRVQISGAPQASMMCVENPESFRHTMCVAPAEGERPVNIMTDVNFEAMSNPGKFPYSTGTFSSNRPRKLTYRKYFNQRLLDVDGRFARDLDYLFVAQYIVEAKQIRDDGNNFAMRQKPSRQFTAAQAKSQEVLSQFMRNDKAYSFMKSIRGSPPYYQRTFYDLLAMIRQLGTPTWFFTLSAADLKWPDMIQTIARQYGVIYTDDEVAGLSFDDKSNWLKRNPVTAARHFQYRLNALFQGFLKSTAKPLGEIADYAIRIEFQARGSPHAHCVIWVKDAPKHIESPDSDVCDFIDQYVSCALPADDCKLRELVYLLQQHKHSSYCKRNKTCRFSFPKPPSPKTLITKFDPENTDIEHSKTVLKKVQKLLTESSTDLSLADLLDKADLTETEYVEALETSCTGNVVVLKRELSECCVNNYNPSVLLAWQANMDIQFVLNAYACVMYVASYIMKTERAMGELLKRVAAEARTDELKTQLRKVGSAFLTHREVSAQEAVYRLLSLPMKQLSRSVVFVNTNPKHERIAVLKSHDSLSQLDDDDTNVFQKSLIDRYQHRPQQLNSMCLAEFAATFATDYKPDDSMTSDALPDVEIDNTSTKITLTDGFGKMSKRRQQAVIRFRKYNKDTEPSNWYRAKLMLYYPWFDEQSDLLAGYPTYEAHYRHVSDTVHTNESKYTKESVDELDVDENGPPEHLWNSIAPSTEEHRLHSIAEGSEQLTEVSQQDLQDNQNILSQSSLHVRFESSANRPEMPPEQYRQYMRELNDEQRSIVMFHRDWCKKAVLELKANMPVEPYRVFLSGPGGVGKSHVIKLIHSDTLKLLKLSGAFEPDDVIVLLTAPTGVAAFGMTLHSTLLLGRSKYSGFQPLSHDRLNSLRTKLSRLMLLIVDEVSMVGSNMLLEIHRRLQQIKGVSDDAVFGNVSILAVGDLYQLPPVAQAPLFNTVSDCYAQLCGSGSLWVDHFLMHELTQVMRQRGDQAFSELLCRVRTNTCTADDIKILKSREIAADSANYPTQALHVYRLNADVDERNTDMLDSIAPQSAQFAIKAIDSVAGQTSHISLTSLSDKRSETGGLHGTLKLAVGARVMLTTNVDVSDGLVNGARGEVVHIVTNTSSDVTSILVKFDNSRVGLKSIQTSPHQARFANAVLLSKHEVVFFAKGKRGSEIKRLQFPLTLAWATTIHKVQDLTLDEIVVDMKGGRFSPGQAYVALSRVKTLAGLHILHFNAKAIKKSIDVENEMLRLNFKTLPPLPDVPLQSSHVNIALLNVRSIYAKLPDIRADTNLSTADILCFSETWLNAAQPTPLLLNDQADIRCDRMSNENRGGVLICVPSYTSPTSVHRFATTGIEAVSVTIHLTGADSLQMAVVYRSPSVAQATLTTLLTRMLTQLTISTLPCVVLGDFNEDISHCQNSAILSLMSSYGFTQIVSCPTTPQGTLIDHVYIRNITSHTMSTCVHVQDTYYSDHDTVYCNIPL